jgi:hypothetical protein
MCGIMVHLLLARPHHSPCFMPAATASRNLQANRERSGIAVGRCRGSQHELVSTTPEDPIMPVSRRAWSLRRIGRGSVDTICQLIVEVQLRREIEAPPGHRRGANLEMHVHRPAWIPARVYRDELNRTACVGDLIAT